MPSSSGKTPPRHPIGSVDNAIRLLLLLRRQSTIRVAEASEALGVVPSTAHRLLAMFEYHGLLEKDPRTRTYSPGPALLSLGMSVVRNDVRAQLNPAMRWLMEASRETVHVIGLEGAQSVFLDAIECDRPVRTTSRVGHIGPAHCSSGGKALLAELSDDELRWRFPDEELGGLTSNSITTRAKLLKELARIRRQGYAISDRENEPDIYAIARVIRAPDGTPVASLSVSRPISRARDEHHDEIIELLKQATERAAEEIA
ncbi:MAG: IclR family transcriptional regulator [Solirubrobacterales bacterium]